MTQIPKGREMPDAGMQRVYDLLVQAEQEIAMLDPNEFMPEDIKFLGYGVEDAINDAKGMLDAFEIAQRYSHGPDWRMRDQQSLDVMLGDYSCLPASTARAFVERKNK